MVRPATRRASAFRFPGVTNREENVAETILRPSRCGVSVRTTVSTSGSSGKFHQNLAVFNFHWIGRQAHVFVRGTSAGAAIELPTVIRAT